jgi:hypothetical protein
MQLGFHSSQLGGVRTLSVLALAKRLNLWSSTHSNTIQLSLATEVFYQPSLFLHSLAHSDNVWPRVVAKQLNLWLLIFIYQTSSFRTTIPTERLGKNFMWFWHSSYGHVATAIPTKLLGFWNFKSYTVFRLDAPPTELHTKHFCFSALFKFLIFGLNTN